MLHLSQGHLNIFANCPPKFQEVYLEQLSTPSSPEQQLKQTWGSHFHLLMQQRELGLPIESLLKNDPELEKSLNALITAAPELLVSDEQGWREAEHCRTLQFNDNYLFTVIYDLLIAKPEQAQIIDWKTYPKPVNKRKLAANWQTRLYLYVLAETSAYLPSQITMTYWFVRLPEQPQSLRFIYDSKQHKKTQQDLTNLLTHLDNCLDAYWQNKRDFKHLPDTEMNCDRCATHNTINSEHQHLENMIQNWQQSLAEIPEIVID